MKVKREFLKDHFRNLLTGELPCRPEFTQTFRPSLTIGFSVATLEAMLTVEQALEAILNPILPLPAERVPLLEAHGRVLAEDVFADVDNPPFDNAAVDGYAVRAEDTTGATREQPVPLRVLGEVPAGAVARQAVLPGACMRVMTGAPIPDGADAMVMVEDTLPFAPHPQVSSPRVPGRATGPSDQDRGEGEAEEVAILAPARRGDHIRRRGEDVKRGARVLAAGTQIGAAEAAMLAAMGYAQPLCVRRPRVAVISTGDELVEITKKPGPGAIRDSNRYALAALVAEAGAWLHSMRRLPDDERATEEAFRTCAGLDGSEPADVIVTSGGVSVGGRDYVKPVLERIGTLELWRVKMKPGKPIAYGRVGNTLFFGLPGNPVSTMVTFELFVRPALWKLAGRTALERPCVHAALTDGVRHSPGRREYIRAVAYYAGNRFHVRPTGAQGSGILSSMLGANALIVLPESSPGAQAGEEVDTLLIGPLAPSSGGAG